MREQESEGERERDREDKVLKKCVWCAVNAPMRGSSPCMASTLYEVWRSRFPCLCAGFNDTVTIHGADTSVGTKDSAAAGLSTCVQTSEFAC